jgi:hypothetical protein
MRSLRGANAGAAIKRLNPIIRGWAAYYRGVVSSECERDIEAFFARWMGVLPCPFIARSQGRPPGSLRPRSSNTSSKAARCPPRRPSRRRRLTAAEMASPEAGTRGERASRFTESPRLVGLRQCRPLGTTFCIGKTDQKLLKLGKRRPNGLRELGPTGHTRRHGKRTASTAAATLERARAAPRMPGSALGPAALTRASPPGEVHGIGQRPRRLGPEAACGAQAVPTRRELPPDSQDRLFQLTQARMTWTPPNHCTRRAPRFVTTQE